jgi:hypothetical protein
LVGFIDIPNSDALLYTADGDLPSFNPITLVGVFLSAKPAIDLISVGDQDFPELRDDLLIMMLLI